MSKNLHLVFPPAGEAAFVGEEPTWTTFPADRYNSQMMRGINWHNYVASDKNIRKYMEEYLHHFSKSPKEEIAAWKKVPDSQLERIVCILARMSLQGFPLASQHLRRINDYIDSFTKKETKKVVVETSTIQTPPVSVVSIQDRIKQQVRPVLSDLDVAIDSTFDGETVDVNNIKSLIHGKGFKLPQLTLVREYLEPKIEEWTAAYKGTDEQLVEGYAYVNRKHMKHIIDSFTEVLDGISSLTVKMKTDRIVRKKPTDKKKIASKLKFMSEFSELNIKSLASVDIIGANVVWVYDTKKRKLGYYEGEAKDSLFVRGTMIDGYKVTCVKTLRKPEEQIKQFMALRKNQTVNWFDGIKAKCATMNGRSNSNLILLRID